MRLEDLDLDALQPVAWPLAWGGEHPELDRKFYRRDGLFYKVWGAKYHVADYVLVDGKFVRHQYADPQSGVAAIDVGLIDAETCPGLVDLLRDGQGRCRGYVMREGVPPRDFDAVEPAFVELMCRRALETGYASTDFCPKNMVRIEGRLSLIDIDTVPTRLDRLHLDVEAATGCLRPHVFPAYRDFILRHFGPR